MNVYDLAPANSQKSFYGKAKVIECEKCTILISYVTPVILKDKSGNLFRLWDGWSATTGKHIASFCGIRKHEYFNLPTTKVNSNYLTRDEQLSLLCIHFKEV